MKNRKSLSSFLKLMLIALPLLFLFCVESNAQTRWTFPSETNPKTLSANTTFQNGNTYNGNNGGAIYITGQNVILNASGNYNLTFNNNSAQIGGAIYIEGNGSLLINLPNNTVTFTNNTATRNGSDRGGGAIFAMGTASSITIRANRLIFDNNENPYAQGWTGGGAVRLRDGAKMYIYAATVIFNNNKSAQDGPFALVTEGSIMEFGTSVSSAQFSNGYGSLGSAFYINFDNSRFNFYGKKAYFLNNTSYDQRGVFFIYSGNNIVFDLDASAHVGGGNLVFFKNYSAAHGAIIHSNSGSGHIFNFTNQTIDATSNTAKNNGGIIAAYSGATIRFTNSTSVFTGNTAELGGIIYLGNASAKVIFNYGSIEFINNLSSLGTSVGNIALISGSMEISNISRMIARGNKAGYGGFLYLPNLTFNFTGSIVELTSNTAFTGYGGGLYFTGSVASFKG
ncbi:MAG: hypothetical protein LBN20_03805, partial [Endomicrobium sp.]|nr:hypothetical protein [Endomicrobium sp.]